MRVAALADIHGNLPALEAVLVEVGRERPDLIVVCGDVASGPMPAETIDLLLSLDKARFVRGNADRELIAAFAAGPASTDPLPLADWCATRIAARHRDFLAAFEDSVVVDDVDGLGRVLFCHGTPRSDQEVMTVETSLERMQTLIAGVDADVVVCGHTHMQFDRTVGGVRVVNAGSVGMPYGEPGADWAMLGPGLRLSRTDYDREAAAARIRALDWPRAEEFARDNVLQVPSAEEALAHMRELEARQLSR